MNAKKSIAPARSEPEIFVITSEDEFVNLRNSTYPESDTATISEDELVNVRRSIGSKTHVHTSFTNSEGELENFRKSAVPELVSNMDIAMLEDNMLEDNMLEDDMLEDAVLEDELGDPNAAIANRKGAANEQIPFTSPQDEYTGFLNADNDGVGIPQLALPLSKNRSVFNLSTRTRAARPMDTETPSYHKYSPRKYLKLTLERYVFPSTRPQGPGDLWTCEFKRCGHKVYNGYSPCGKARIQEHLKLHAGEGQENTNLSIPSNHSYPIVIGYVVSFILLIISIS